MARVKEEVKGIVLHDNQGNVTANYTGEMIETIKNTVAKGATDAELLMFLTVANKYFTGVTTDNYRMYIQCLISYLQGVKQGMKPEEARTFLPNATKTNIMMGVNLRELRHIWRIRMY